MPALAAPIDMTQHMRTIKLASLLVLSAIASCSDPPTESAPLTKKETRIGKTGNVIQTITLDPAAPAPGENVTVRSVITNRGSSAIQLSARVCGLDYAGSLELTWPPEVLKCGAYSSQTSLAPGDSIVGHDIMRVSSAPGRYVLEVRHALSPETWVDLPVEVRRK